MLVMLSPVFAQENQTDVFYSNLIRAALTLGPGFVAAMVARWLLNVV
jgi:hypothetical protein